MFVIDYSFKFLKCNNHILHFLQLLLRNLSLFFLCLSLYYIEGIEIICVDLAREIKRKTRVSKGLITFARNSLPKPRILIRDYRDNLDNPIISELSLSHRASTLYSCIVRAVIVIAAQPDQYLYTFTPCTGITLRKRDVLSIISGVARSLAKECQHILRLGVAIR